MREPFDTWHHGNQSRRRFFFLVGFQWNSILVPEHPNTTKHTTLYFDFFSLDNNQLCTTSPLRKMSSKYILIGLAIIAISCAVVFVTYNFLARDPARAELKEPKDHVNLSNGASSADARSHTDASSSQPTTAHTHHPVHTFKNGSKVVPRGGLKHRNGTRVLKLTIKSTEQIKFKNQPH